MKEFGSVILKVVLGFLIVAGILAVLVLTDILDRVGLNKQTDKVFGFLGKTVQPKLDQLVKWFEEQRSEKKEPTDGGE